MTGSTRRRGTRWYDPSRIVFWLVLVLAIWGGLAVAIHLVPSIAGAAIGAGVGATVSIAVFLANRGQSRRQTTLDLLAEYYSADFADRRRAAERFMRRHADADWSVSDPYVLWADEPDLAGYGAVVRYWQRVAILELEGELRSDLAHRLLAREVGYWNALIFDPMKDRPNMYVRDLLTGLVARFSQGSQKSAFADGTTAGSFRSPCPAGKSDDLARGP